MILRLDGEWIVDAQPDIGYLHRAFEKLAEERSYLQYVPLTDRWDYLSSMMNNLAYVQAVEKLAGIEVPERAQYIRVLVAELNRIASHLVFVGTYGLDLGATSPFIYCFRDREKIIDLFEMLCGARLTYNYMRFGGVSADLPEGFVEKVVQFVEYFPPMLDENDALLTGNEIFILRTRGVGIISPELGLQYALTGPNLRASGVKRDLRKDEPYSVYSRLQFEIPTATAGDCLDRYRVRVQEMRESLKMVMQCVQQLPEGLIQSKVPRNLKPPAGEVYACIESSRGALGVYLISDGSATPYRLKIRAPSFINLAIIPEIAKGWKVADLVAILGSVDLVMGEVDR